MNLEQLTGRQVRLTQELLAAYCTAPRNNGRIERLIAELASTEGEIVAVLALQENADSQLRHAA